MPFVDITYIEDQHKPDDIAQVSQIIHSSLEEHFHIPPNDRFHLLHPVRREQVIANPEYLIAGRRSDKLLIIKITCGKGRTEAQKRGLYHTVASDIHATVGIPAEDIFVILYETELSAWSFGEGCAQLIDR